MRNSLFPAALALASACICGPANANEVARLGELEVHSEAVPTTELTSEAARKYNITPAADRGLLTVTLIRKGNRGKAESIEGQVYAGGFTHDNRLFTIPIREIHQDNGVYYLGEYRINSPGTIRFLVNANVAGKPMKVDFSRSFDPLQLSSN